MSSPVAETRTCWASEKNASMNATTMAAEDEAEPVRPATGAERRRGPAGVRASGASATRGRARQRDGARAGALVDGHRSVAEREADARTARIEEPERIGLAGRAPLAELELEALGVLAAVAAARAPRAGGGRRSCDGWTWWRLLMRVLLLPFRGLGGESLGGPQAGAPGSGVGGDLGVGRGQRRAGDEPQARVPAAHADRQLGRADAAAPLGLEEPLDDPVLERVVAQDDEPAARAGGGRGRRRGPPGARRAPR